MEKIDTGYEDWLLIQERELIKLSRDRLSK